MAAPKGNKFAKGSENSGRPKKFKTVKAMQTAIDKYFKECDEHKKEFFSKVKGEVVTVHSPVPYTIEGLAETIGVTRETLLTYEKHKRHHEFSDTVKKAKLKIQRNKVERGLNGDSHPIFSMFDLKNNHGYEDKTKHVTDDGKGGDAPMGNQSQIDYSLLSDAALKEIISAGKQSSEN